MENIGGPARITKIWKMRLFRGKAASKNNRNGKKIFSYRRSILFRLYAKVDCKTNTKDKKINKKNRQILIEVEVEKKIRLGSSQSEMGKMLDLRNRLFFDFQTFQSIVQIESINSTLDQGLIIKINYFMKTIAEVEQRSEQSSSYERVEQTDETDKTPRMMSSKARPFNFFMDYDDFCLNINWNFRMMQAMPDSYSRHILLIDFEAFTLLEIETIIRNYSQMMSLGDFLKVVDFNGHRILHWKERTNNPIDFSGLSKRRSRGFDVLGRVLQDTEEFSEKICLVFFLKHDITNTSSLFKGIDEAIRQGRLQAFVTIFAHQNCKQLWSSPPQIIAQPLMLVFDKGEELMFKIKSLFLEYAKQRARRLDITLKCLNGYMQIHKTPNTEWRKVNRELLRRMHNLNNYTDYMEKVQLVSPNLNRIEFSLEVSVQQCNGDTFVLEQDFSIDTSTKLLSVRELPKQRKVKVLGDSLFATDFARDVSKMQVHIERVSISELREDFSSIE